jgi:glutamate carboxypeptidase
MAEREQGRSREQGERAIAWLHGQQSAMEALLRALVEISSWTGDKAGVDAAGAVLRAAVPLPCTVLPSERYGDHLVFHAGRPASAGGVLLVGHLDTVFPRGAFVGYRVEGSIARGPGVLDMKGGLVVATFALQALAQVGLLDALALSLMVVSDEEVGSPDSAPHLRALAAGAQAALVFESGRAGDAIITRRKGTGTAVAVAHGRAAHAGNAHREGANAIWALARFIDRAQSLTDYDRGVTVNAGTVSGGIGKNTVPARAEALLDLRFVTHADGEALRTALLAAAEQSAVPGTRVELTWGAGRAPLERSDASGALRAAYGACQGASGLGDGEMPLVGGGSDAAITSEAGVPSIDGLGPRGAGFHTLDEYVELDSLIPKTEALLRYLLATAG